jgi:putative transposase
MIRLEDRRSMVHDIAVARSAGARLLPACLIVGITLRTLQRWQCAAEVIGVVCADARPLAVRPVPAHALSDTERAHIMSIANEPRFAAIPPARIVPMLADEGVYVASEASFQRVLCDHGQTKQRGRARAAQAVRPPTTHVASAPGEVWCWDMTYLRGPVLGQWFYLYLILDLYSRKIVGWEVHANDHADHAAHLVRRTALAEGIHAMTAKPVLRGDNGATLKATTVLAMLHWLGHQAVVLAATSVRRQCLRRVAVPHRQVPPRVSGEWLPRSRRGARMGHALRALVQHRASPQRNPLREPGATAFR